MKRLTVRRELKKRLSESLNFLRMEPMTSDLDQVYGTYDEKSTKQAIENHQRDVEQIKFLLNCLDNREKLQRILYSSPSDEVDGWDVYCGSCGTKEQEVRPGKYQCPKCE